MSWPYIFLFIALVMIVVQMRQNRDLRRSLDNQWSHDPRAPLTGDPRQALPPPSSPDLEIEAQMKALKERIAVLERIATEDRRVAQLDQEINELRDR